MRLFDITQGMLFLFFFADFCLQPGPKPQFHHLLQHPSAYLLVGLQPGRRVLQVRRPLRNTEIPPVTPLCVSGESCTTQPRGTCESISAAHGISSASLYMGNQDRVPDCGEVDAGVSICIPLSCTRTRSFRRTRAAPSRGRCPSSVSVSTRGTAAPTFAAGEPGSAATRENCKCLR
ncbi:hypothetical protein MAPG_11275 [Magnaporthiopsis poae ATCC 64411]|uniref:LysM domain-containing protein n=1 Tax=Magnaporthiopsis poae (strain ATCC 64411 / 73-15) TaxID=644358 RepID=A0A0C4EEU4_MAGP6|nr:hypothetical protein MAPG_11275 [Magnaporthiopsis poae ATCC 64411]